MINQCIFYMINFHLRIHKQSPIAQPLEKHVGQLYQNNVALSLRNTLRKIQTLRNQKIASLPDIHKLQTTDAMQQYINTSYNYIRYAMIIYSKFLFPPQQPCVQLKVEWSNNPERSTFTSYNTIVGDLIAIHYNCSIVLLRMGIKFIQKSFELQRKNAIVKLRQALWHINEVREKFGKQIVTQNQFSPEGVQILNNLVFGLIYKCLFLNFQQNEIKFGIDKIGIICNEASKAFSKAVQIAYNYFKVSKSYSVPVQNQILCITFLNATIFEAKANMKFAKYFSALCEDNSSKMADVLGYYQKAQNQLNFSLQSEIFKKLTGDQQNQLKNIQNELSKEFEYNKKRNDHVYKQKMRPAQQMFPPIDVPQNLVINKLKPKFFQEPMDPNQIKLFSQLMSQKNYKIATQLQGFAQKKKVQLQHSFNVLNQSIANKYAQSNVNFLATENEEKGLPKPVQQKIHQIRKAGGKVLQSNFNMIHQSTNFCMQKMGQLNGRLAEQQKQDQQLRNKYGQKWNRTPSHNVNADYVKKLVNYQKKLQTAMQVDLNTQKKYQNNKEWLTLIQNGDQAILKKIPQGDTNKKLQSNNLSIEVEQVQKTLNQAQAYLENCNNFLTVNYMTQAAKYHNKQVPTQKIIEQTFDKAQKEISKYNQTIQIVSQMVNDLCLKAAQIYKNTHKKGQQVQKYEGVIKQLSQLHQCYGQTSQGLAFYSQLKEHLNVLNGQIEDLIYSRNLQKQSILDNLRQGGFGGSGQWGKPASNIHGSFFSKGNPNQNPNQNPNNNPNNNPNQNPYMYPNQNLQPFQGHPYQQMPNQMQPSSQFQPPNQGPPNQGQFQAPNPYSQGMWGPQYQSQYPKK